MPAKREPAFASQLLSLNDAISLVDLSHAVMADPMPFGVELLTFSPQCFIDSTMEARHVGFMRQVQDGPIAGILSRGNGAGMIFNDKQPILAA